MKNHPGFQSLVRAGGGLLLLGVALTAWGINITLNDGTNSVTCATSGTTTIAANGDINANVSAGGTCDLSGGGDPPPPGSFTLSVAKTGTGGGTVTSSPTGISCGGDCSEAYAEGTPVSLTAAADSGSTFGGWSGACTGTGACNLTMSGNRSVTATFTADGGGGACGALPANTVVVDTGNLNVAWPQPPVYLVPPQQITAFKVTVPSGFTGRDNFLVAKSSSGLKSKLVVVSTCPGVLTPVGAACTVSGVDTTTARLSGNASDPAYYCKLTPGVYYVNAVSKNAVTDTSYNCSTTTNCSFLASRSAPY